MRLWCCLLCLALPCSAQSIAQAGGADLAWKTDSATSRFAAAHGQQAAVMGYPDSGLEIWAYPLQLGSGYTISFREPGQIQPNDGRKILRRIEYRPTETIRIYVGPDFVVREHLFVPLDRPGAILSYEVQGRPDLQIEAHLQPSFNLMWPGALGGQSIQWNEAVSGYVERESVYGYSAAIASPDIVSHDDTVNRTIPLDSGVAFILRPHATPNGVRIATLYAALDAPHAQTPGQATLQLEKQQAQLEAAAQQHVENLLSHSLQITTPDPELNRSLAWAELALDQAWVCSSKLGCGEIAGYGPSRPGRRPQYDWFFGGDGLIAMQGMLAAGDYERAREELEFITRYQNPSNGMIWHEMSQSAALIDWSKYPYMYVHVDITFQYLAALGDYVTITGDKDFVTRHWTNIEAAYRYCKSLISPETGLPQIPVGQEGMNEQDRMRDDIGLSSEWVDAAEGYAKLAHMAGHPGEAAAAQQTATNARNAIASQDWDEQHHLWLSGHTITGRPIYDPRPRPTGLLSQHIFTPAQVNEVLDRIASPEFQTDWGSRSMSDQSPSFDPNSYSKGSISALGSADVADAFWNQHRPLTAWSIWNSLLAWNTLDSAGHIHEVAAGDLFHPEIESVPEQTWSSAGYLSSTVHGLLGVEIHSAEHHLIFAPRLPADWHSLSLRNVRIGDTLLDIHLAQDEHGIDLTLENHGSPMTIDFDPDIPLGAKITNTVTNGKRAQFKLEEHPQELSAQLHTDAAPGTTHCHLAYTGGVQLLLEPQQPALGDASRNLRITSATFTNHTLTIAGYMRPSGANQLTLFTPWTPSSEDASVAPQEKGRYQVQLRPSPSSSSKNDAYVPIHAEIHFLTPGREAH